MKKIIIFLPLILCLLVCGCGRKSDRYSFAPIQDESAVSEKQRSELTKFLQEAPAMPDGISFYAYRIVRQSDGYLRVDGFVRNNTGKTVSAIEGEFNVKLGKKKAASAEFSLMPEQFGKLADGDSRPWSLLYKKNQVLIADTDYKGYTVEADVTYKTSG